MQPLVGGAVGVVYASANASFKKGDLVQGMLGWELFTLVPKGQGLRPLDPKGLPLSYFLGVLGMPGLTAYAGLFDIGAPKEGETVFVSAASGAVGQIVGQLAKLKGAHVVGSAGSAEKVS
jgi:NADPH-dependent curcumin reductase CurA